jgi:hypothetical protein
MLEEGKDTLGFISLPFFLELLKCICIHNLSIQFRLIDKEETIL